MTELHVDLVDGVGVVTLDRPARRNAMNHELYVAMRDAVRELDERADVRAIVLTGAGKAFCAGADVTDLFQARLSGAPLPSWTDWPGLIRSAKPVVAAVNGAALGAGLSLVLPCDRILAAATATFSMRFIRMGLVPELGSSRLLPRRIGVAAATDLMLTGRDVAADEALALGLADEVVAPDALRPTAIDRAKALAVGPDAQIRWIKELLDHNADDADLDRVQAREVARLDEALASPAHAEAVAAFRERRA